MAMVTPICTPISAFDATNDYTFYFTSNGGNQVVANKLYIYNNTTGANVYTSSLNETYSFSAVLPANTLNNGNYYTYSFVTYDINNNASTQSNPVPFRCYSAPSLVLNVTDGKQFQFSYLNLTMTYNQNEGELLDTLIVNLYSSTGTLIDTTGQLYSSNIPPVTFTYTFNNLMSNTNYYLIGNGTTVNGTTFGTGQINFTVNYTQPNVYTKLELTNNCEDGYVNISSNIIAVSGNGKNYYFSVGMFPQLVGAYPQDGIYPNYKWNSTATDYLNLEVNNSYVYWDAGYEVPSTFAYELWFNPIYLNKTICTMGTFLVTTTENAYDDNVLSFEFLRGIPTGETTPKDFIKVNMNQNGISVLTLYSNYIEPASNVDNLQLLFKKVGAVYTLELQNLTPTENEVIWNGDSNVEYNRITDILYEDETFSTIDTTQIIGDISNVFPLTSISLFNILAYDMYLTKNSTYTIQTVLPTTDGNTVLIAGFAGTLNAGTLDYMFGEISSIRIKRRLQGSTSTFEWNTIYELQIDTIEQLESLSYNDFFSPSGQTFEYAFVPVLNSGAEGNYITGAVTTNFDGLFISGYSNGNIISFKFYNGIAYSDTTSFAQIGILNPIGNTYATIVRNGSINYLEGEASGDLFGYNFEQTRLIDRASVVQQTNDFNNFIKNGNSKIIKDWNGNIWLIQISSTNEISYLNNYAQGITNVKIPWIEQGKYDNQSDLYNNGLSDYAG